MAVRVISHRPSAVTATTVLPEHLQRISELCVVDLDSTSCKPCVTAGSSAGQERVVVHVRPSRGRSLLVWSVSKLAGGGRGSFCLRYHRRQSKTRAQAYNALKYMRCSASIKTGTAKVPPSSRLIRTHLRHPAKYSKPKAKSPKPQKNRIDDTQY